MFYFQKRVTEERGVREIQEQRMTIEAAQPMVDYITQCLDIWALRGLELLGQQGGVIFQSQGGLTDDNDFRPSDEGRTYVRYGPENAKVAFGIVRLTERENVAALNNVIAFRPPEYPYLDFPYRQLGVVPLVVDDQATLSLNTLTVLKATPPAIALKENLEVYITKQVLDCVRFEEFEKQNLQIIDHPEQASTMATITETNMRFFLTYPIEIVQTQTQAKLHVDNFTVEYPFKLLKFFQMINNVVDSDSNNISFSPRGIDTAEYSISVIDGARPLLPRDDVLRFTDKTSLILDKPYTFLVARQNRAPALWLINQNDLNQKKLCTQCFSTQQDGSRISIINPSFDGKTNSTATLHIENDCWDARSDYSIFLTAQDPDEDNVTFSVTGGSALALQLPITQAVWNTLQNGPSPGEKVYPVRIKVSDGTPEYGMPEQAWQEYQEVNLIVEPNQCPP